VWGVLRCGLNKSTGLRDYTTVFMEKKKFFTGKMNLTTKEENNEMIVWSVAL